MTHQLVKEPGENQDDDAEDDRYQPGN